MTPSPPNHHHSPWRPPPWQVVAANGLGSASGGPVRVVAGKVEELQELGLEGAGGAGGGCVDVLVSEWMGYALLFESMLDSVGGGPGAGACLAGWWRAMRASAG